MTEDLKPCPLCKRQVRIADLGGWEIICDCGLMFALNLKDGSSDKEHTIEAWNTRA